ncbi:MAG: PIF1 family ATP-dependent DNA helicase [Oligoflexia bacterium]|nr:PIF1 family ATP-dependent DNA helicase [Oligoflexia bacterium]
MNFSADQQKAMNYLLSTENVFLTGKAGTGKSTVIQKYLEFCGKDVAVLASTGAAAVLIGGRTFHSFFGLGILEGGSDKTIERAAKNPFTKKRIKKTSTIIIDEVSMLTGETLATANALCKLVRNNLAPWGGIRVIAVGDFAQLPPVQRTSKSKDWAFLHPVWQETNFQSISLHTVHRTKDNQWIQVLNLIREGKCSELVTSTLNSLTNKQGQKNTPRLFSHRADAEEYNNSRLKELSGELFEIPTDFRGEEHSIESLKKQCPISEVLYLKEDALVMIRKNDQEQLFVNGSLALVKRIEKNSLTLELLENGIEIQLDPMKFELLDGNGEIKASAKNFPVSLAYGTTIHKSQGATIDSLQMKLDRLWECGQAYVALSRVRDHSKIFLESWSPRSIIADNAVIQFHSNLPQ